MSARSIAAAKLLAEQGVGVTVIDPRWVAPVPESVVRLAADYGLVVTVEDGIKRGGIGSLVAEKLSDAQVDTPLRRLAFPNYFPLHASRGQLLEDVGLAAEGIAESVQEWLG